jgi:formyl-CoA transferase
MIGEVTKTRDSKYWVELMNEAGIPCGPIYTVDQTFADPQVKHLEMAQSVKSKKGEQGLVGQPIKLSRTPAKLVTAAPGRGEHNEEVLAEFGFTAAEIAGLKQQGVV